MRRRYRTSPKRRRTKNLFILSEFSLKTVPFQPDSSPWLREVASTTSCRPVPLPTWKSAGFGDIGEYEQVLRKYPFVSEGVSRPEASICLLRAYSNHPGRVGLRLFAAAAISAASTGVTTTCISATRTRVTSTATGVAAGVAHVGFD
jgi:hypothetical protein